MNFLNYFFIAVHKEYQSEKSPIIDSQKSPKTSRKLQKMRQLQASKVDQMFSNTRYIYSKANFVDQLVCSGDW